MTYDKETRAELTETELKEDKIRELSNEQDDGDFETWKEENFEDLKSEFIRFEDNEEFKEFCRECWKQK